MLARFWNWLFTTPAPEVEEKTEVDRVERDSFFSTEINLDDTITKAERLQRLNERAFPRTVGDTLVMNPNNSGQLATFAQDSNDAANSLKAVFALNQVGIPEVQALWYGSQGFIGYQLCALLAQNWLINKACLIPARDAIRKGYKFTVNDGSAVGPEILDAINKANKRYRLNRNLVEYVKMGRVFGVRIALCVIESDDPEYYVKPFNPDSIKPGSYRGITQIDPYWCVPELTTASASNPASLDFYEPTYWIVNNQRYHKSHLVIMRGPEVADILKPSYLYGGLSVPQMIYERVYAAERTANEAPQLALTKRAMVFYTDVAKALANQAQFETRLQTWAAFRDNYGVKIADTEADKIEQHDTSLGDLDAVIMTQYQIVAAAANIPATKLLGTTPKGFNASGDYEAESYHEELETIQTSDMEPLIDRHTVCLIRSDIAPRFGVQPFAVDCTWEPLDSLSSAEVATINKTKAETAKILAVDIGAIDGQEVRAALTADEQSGYNGLPTLEDQDDAPEENPANPEA
jgi:phage-related protein (TIGR01555 family)